MARPLCVGLRLNFSIEKFDPGRNRLFPVERRTKQTSPLGKGSMVEVLKVSSKSSPNAVAGALSGAVRHGGAVEVQVVGAGALNQAVKAVAIARLYLAESGVDLVCVPTFTDIEIAGEGRTAIRLRCEDRQTKVRDELRVVL